MNKKWLLGVCVMSVTQISNAHQINSQALQEERPATWLEYFVKNVGAKASITISQQDGYRYIESDGIPDHTPGQFPNRGNPNRISKQDFSFRVPLNPVKNRHSRYVMPHFFGVALNGIPFDAATNEFWNGNRNWNYEALAKSINLGLDRHNAHVQPNGTYHYHGEPTGFIELSSKQTTPLLIGYAADGFPIYHVMGYKDARNAQSGLKELKSSYRLKKGVRSSGPGGRYDGTYTADFEYIANSGDLDNCNGRFAITSEYPEGTYQYVITHAFPFVPRCLYGDMDASFQKSPGGRGGPGGRGSAFPDELQAGGRSGPRMGGNQRPRQPPPEAKEACVGKLLESQCEVVTPRGEISGTCRKSRFSSDVICIPTRPPRR